MKKIFYFLLGLVAVILVASFLPPFTQGYEIKTAARLACNDFIKQARYKTTGDPAVKFLDAARRAGVKLDPKQFSFAVEEKRQDNAWVCHFRVRYPTRVEWAFIGQVFQELPQPIWGRDIALDHSVSNTY